MVNAGKPIENFSILCEFNREVMSYTAYLTLEYLLYRYKNYLQIK